MIQRSSQQDTAKNKMPGERSAAKNPVSFRAGEKKKEEEDVLRTRAPKTTSED